MNIFVSSLSFRAKKEDLAELFAQFGEVISARIIFNRETRRSKGYGFVEMPNNQRVMQQLRHLTVLSIWVEQSMLLLQTKGHPEKNRKYCQSEIKGGSKNFPLLLYY